MKLQAPSSKLQINPKLQVPNVGSTSGSWKLELGTSLELGAWSLELLQAPPRDTGGKARGFVLAAVLVVIMMASMVAVSLLFRIKAEDTAVAAGAGSEQAWSAAMSGVCEAMRIASAITPEDTDWQDNPALFHQRLVFDDAVDQWCFTIYSYREDQESTLHFGLADEAAKLNLHTATEAMLTRLPGMTPYLAHGLLDFLDKDDLPHAQGAEQEYYDMLPRPYASFNGPLSSLYELFLVRGFNPDVLHGEDANFNCTLDPRENDGDDFPPPDNGDSKLDPGLRAYATTCSYDLDEDNDGQVRLDLNEPSETFWQVELPGPIVEYINTVRTNKIKMKHPAELLEAKTKLPNGKEIVSGVGKAELALMLDKFSGTLEYHLHGLINVNTASAAVLQTLPEIDESLAQTIVATRKGLRAEQRKTPAWLYEEGILDADKFKLVAPLLTTRSRQFSFQVIGYGLRSGRYRVLEVTIDVAAYDPAVTYLRDITRLGLPFRIEAEPNETLTTLRRSATKEVAHGG
jgi:DNA uptake protein ComE-like DNA-binding protein